MKKEDLYRAIGGVSDELILEAEPVQKNHYAWKKVLPMAAAAVLLLGGTIVLRQRGLFTAKDAAPDTPALEEAASPAMIQETAEEFMTKAETIAVTAEEQIMNLTPRAEEAAMEDDLALEEAEADVEAEETLPEMAEEELPAPADGEFSAAADADLSADAEMPAETVKETAVVTEKEAEIEEEAVAASEVSLPGHALDVMRLASCCGKTAGLLQQEGKVSDTAYTEVLNELETLPASQGKTVLEKLLRAALSD